MNPALKQTFKKLLPYLFALLLAAIIFFPILSLDFRADDYHLFRTYSNSELSYVWTHNWDLDGIENDGLRPISIFIYHAATSLGGFNRVNIFAVAFLVVIIKVLLAVKLASYFIKNKALLLAGVFLTAIAYCLVSHHYSAIELPANICIILILSSLILLFNISRTRYKRAAFIGSLILLFLAAFTKEIAVPFLLFPPVMFIYLAKSNELNFKTFKNKALFLAACILPLFYFIWRLIFFTSAEYQTSLMTHFHFFLVGMGSLFNILYIYSFRHNGWQPSIPILAAASITIVYAFDLILLFIGIGMIKNIKKIFSDRLNLLILLLIFFSCVIFPVNGGGRLQFLYLFFSFIFIIRFMELSMPNLKWQKAFLLSALIMIMVSVYISYSSIYDMMSPASPDVIKEELRVFDDINLTDRNSVFSTRYLLRDEYKSQLEYLKAKVAKDRIYLRQ